MNIARFLTAIGGLCLAFHVSAFESVDTLETVAELIDANYADTDKAARCAAAVRGLDTESALFVETDPVAFSDAVTDFLRTTCKDRHFRLKPRAEAVIEAPNAGVLEGYLTSQRAANGFVSVTRSEDNVAVIVMSRFYDTTFAQDTLTGVMQLAHGADAVVIDLRGNPGGSRAMVRLLASYFLTQPVQLNAFIDRSGTVTEELWSLPEVEGPRFETQPLYIVVNSKTGSAAEAFSYHLQALDRAVVVGESTAGGANPGEVFGVGEEFTLFVSTQISRNPVTGSSWEGDGVQPDVVVGSDAALDRAVELAAGRARASYAAQREAINAAARRAFDRLKEARALRREGDWAGYARLHEKVLEAEPALAYLWLDAGLGYHFDGDYPAAQAAYSKALEVPATRAMAMYQLACTNALQGNIDAAIKWLGSSLDAGFEEDGYLINDSDLDALREDPRFQVFLATRHLQ